MKLIKPSHEIIPQGHTLEDIYKHIERVARTCYKSEDRITENSAHPFVERLIENKHTAMLEHGTVYLSIPIIDAIALYSKLLNNPFSNYELSDNGQTYHITTNLRVIIENGLQDVLKYICEPTELHMRRHTVKFTCDQGVMREFTRHRAFSFAVESTRFCVSGDTLVKCKNYHSKHTIKDLYEDRISHNRLSQTLIEVLNTDTGILEFSKIKNVFKNGVQEVFELKTRLGYSIKCTADHQIYTENGWKKLSELSAGDTIYVNGVDADRSALYQNKEWLSYQYLTLGKSVTDISSEFGYSYDVIRKWLTRFNITKPKDRGQLYRDKEWLYHQNITLNKTFVDIAKEFGYNVSTLKNWGRRFGLPKKGTGYFNEGRTPWNKGLAPEDDQRVLNQANALREFHHDKKDTRRILKEDTSRYQKYRKDACEICGNNSQLHVHHIDSDRTNNNPNNLITLCNKCHLRVHNKSLMVLHSDVITDISSAGFEEVYDLEIDNHHNYVANGIIVHNCNYSKGKFGGELTFIRPCWFATASEHTKWLFRLACYVSEKIYLRLLKHGWTPEKARNVLPLATKCEMVMTGFEHDWRHFFDLRAHGTTGKPHPQAEELAKPLFYEFVDKKL